MTTPTDTEKLDRCPFCGGIARVVEWMKYGQAHFTANCTRCDATATDSRDAASATKAWNRRAHESRAQPASHCGLVTRQSAIDALAFVAKFNGVGTWEQACRMLVEAQPASVADGWRDKFDELLEDYAGARAEVAVWNVTQSVQPPTGIRLPRSRLAKLLAHVDQIAAAPQPAKDRPVCNRDCDCVGECKAGVE